MMEDVMRISDEAQVGYAGGANDEPRNEGQMVIKWKSVKSHSLALIQVKKRKKKWTKFTCTCEKRNQAPHTIPLTKPNLHHPRRRKKRSYWCQGKSS